MEIRDLSEFIHYLDRIHQRTRRVIDQIPPDKIEWRFKDGAFSFGDIIRHLANLQRYMYAETIRFKESRYPGHDSSFVSGYTQIVEYFETKFNESRRIFLEITVKDLERKCTTPGNVEIRVWKWLRSMIEHEIHHRGQLHTLLNLVDQDSPPLYGLTSEQVKDRSKPLG